MKVTVSTTWKEGEIGEVTLYSFDAPYETPEQFREFVKALREGFEDSGKITPFPESLISREWKADLSEIDLSQCGQRAARSVEDLQRAAEVASAEMQAFREAQ